MRDYGKIAPTFWTRGTGKKLRGNFEAIALATYLMTGPHSNMIGLYYLPIPTICHETGLEFDTATELLELFAVEDFAYYDKRAEMVWIPTMAKYQIGDTLKGGDKPDKKVHAVLKEVLNAGKHPFAKDFFERYSDPFSLEIPPHMKGLPGLQAFQEGLAKGFQPESGVLRKVNPQEQDQKQEQEQEQKGATAAAAEDKPDTRAVIAELERWPSCMSLPIREVAQTLVLRWRPREVSKGTKLDWLLTAIGEAASDGTGLNNEALTRKLRAYCDAAKPPRRAQPIGVSVQNEQARRASEQAFAAAERNR